MMQKLLFFLAWISAIPCSSAQTLQETLLFAREQQATGNIDLALKTYQRVLFFDRGQHQDECQRQLAALYAEQGDFEKSAFYCDLLYQRATSDSLRYEALFSKTGMLMLQSQYRKALLELYSLPQDLSEPWLARKRLYLGAAHFGIRDFERAKEALWPLFAESDQATRATFEQLIRKAEHAARKRPRTARMLSTILPGAGQFYAGDIKNGVNSLLLNGLLLYWFVDTGLSFTFLDASLTVAPWLFRYYGGGVKKAGEMVEKEKEKRFRAIFQAILKTIPTK